MVVPSERAGEEGLTLVEMLVAIVVIGFVLMAMAGVAFASLRSVQTTERVTAATHLGGELLESYAALSYDELGLYSTAATTAFAGSTFDGAALVLFPDALTPDPRIPEPERTIARNGVDYAVETAVVWVDDPATTTAQDYKRVVVTLSWTSAGSPQTTRVEALRAPGPTDQPLTVTVTPDIVELDDDGEQTTPLTVTIEAKEPQTTVTVDWLDRNGSSAGPRTASPDAGNRTWTLLVDDQEFANGATLFTVTGTVSGTTDQVVTTLGRGLFLQPLAFAASATTVTPGGVTYQPAYDDVAGEFCTDIVRIETEVEGALLSDPVTLTIHPDAAAPTILPLTGDEVPTTRGTRFWVDVAVEDLDITGPDGVPVLLTATRPVGAVQPTVTQDLTIPVSLTAELHEDAENPELVTGYAPCP